MNITKYETNLRKFKYLHNEGTKKMNRDLGDTENNLIVLYPEITYQSILGFGGAFTESAGYCFSKLPDKSQKQLLDDYFSENGNNYTLCRTHIGSCDFCLDTYSYSSTKTLSDFNIDRDKKYIIPFIKRAQKIKPDLTFISTPWSPPAFMKDNNRLKHGGKILDEYKDLWAEYLVKYFNSYKNEDINIDYMTIQNEPKASQFWESCVYTAKEEQEMIKNHIVPIFKKNNIPVKLLIWDHNKERIVYRAKEIFDDPEVKEIVAGIGYHYYSGDYFENIATFKDLYSDKLAIHTEGCTGYEHLWFRKKLRRIPNAEIYAHDIIGDLNAGANGYIDWNMMLDYHGGPTHVHNKCNSPIMLNKKGNDYNKTLAYYYIGHFSRFIKPDAKRIAFSKYTDELELTSFINTDNTVAVVILNKTKHNKHIKLCLNEKIYIDNIDPHSILTFVIED